MSLESGLSKRINPLDAVHKARAASDARRKELLQQFTARQSKPKSPRNLQKTETSNQGSSQFLRTIDIDATIAAASHLQLMVLNGDILQATPLNRPTIGLLREFLQTLATGESGVVLQWPFGQRDISLLHPLAMLSLICVPKIHTTDGYGWCEEPETFRTLYFPWRNGATAANQASFLVRRDEVVSRNGYHLTRRSVQLQNRNNLLDSLHETLGHLHALSKRDGTKPHLAHPTLLEIYPTAVADHLDATPHYFEKPIGELFGRVRHGAALDRLTDHRASLSDPYKAPYGLFGVSPPVQFKQALAAPVFSPPMGVPPDICILDLGPPALNRLGETWSATVQDYISEVSGRFPGLPFLAITQDTYVHQRVSSMLHKLQKMAQRSTVLVRVSRDPLTFDPPVAATSCTKVNFTTVAGPSADAIAALAEAARGSTDPFLAGTLRREMGSLRKAASLPCGLATAYDSLCQEIGQSSAESFLEHCSRGNLLAPLDDALNSEISGAERKRLVNAREAVRAAFDSLDVETPIGSLIEDIVASVVRKPNRTLVAFASGIDLILGVNRLTDDTDSGRAMRDLIDSGQVILSCADNLEAKLAEIEALPHRESWKRLIMISPNLDWLSKVAVRAWLPDELSIVCERTLAARIASVFMYLSTNANFGEERQLAARIGSIAEAAMIEVEGRSVGSVDLSLESRSVPNELEMIIDLTDDDADESGEICELTLSSGRTIRARSGATIVRYDGLAAINPFETARARTLVAGDIIVVPDTAFIGEARDILPLRVLAQSWVDVYHTTVKASLVNIPGDTLSAKARTIHTMVRARGARTQSHAAVLGWLKVEEYMQSPPESRQSHAPQRRREFEAFMGVLGVNESVTKKMWSEGIQSLRVDRRRAGQKLAQAFVSVLVDPHGTASGFSATVREGIGALRSKALDHLDQVINVEKFN